MQHNIKQETIEAGIKITPAIGGFTWYSLTLNEWVAIATIAYILLQIGLLIPKYVHMYQEWRGKG